MHDLVFLSNISEIKKKNAPVILPTWASNELFTPRPFTAAHDETEM